MFFSQPHILIKLTILIAALIVISVGLYLVKHHGESRRTKVVDFILVGLAVLSLMNYFSFKPFSAAPHTWDIFHYYVGSKYFPEIGYTRLYACVTKAEAESGNAKIRDMAFKRYTRNLQNNNIVPAQLYFSDENFCKARFSTQRWNEFKGDVFFFHAHMGEQFEKAMTDHGFNASPMWAIAGGFISNSIPLSDQALMWVKQIDIIFLFGSITSLIWAFGLPTAAFSVITFTSLEMVSWSWCGNSLLRFDWFFLAVLSVCAMKRGYYLVAGMALGYAAALRIFPAVFLIGPLVSLVYAFYKRQHEIKIAYAKLFGGVILSTTILVVSATAIYGEESLFEFFDNSQKHAATFVDNYVGLRTVLAYDPDSAERSLPDLSSTEKLEAWHAIKLEARQHVMLIYLAVFAIALMIFIPAVLSGGTWQTLALGSSFIPFAWTELSNYYYVFLAVTATLFAVNRKVAYPLLGIGIVSEIGHLFQMWYDEEFVLFSAALCIGFIIVWWQVSHRSKAEI